MKPCSICKRKRRKGEADPCERCEQYRRSHEVIAGKPLRWAGTAFPLKQDAAKALDVEEKWPDREKGQ